METINSLVKRLEIIRDNAKNRKYTPEERAEVLQLLARCEAWEGLYDSQNQIVRPDPKAGLSAFRSTAGPFQSFGEQLQAIRAAGMPGQRVDERLYEVESRSATGLQEGRPSDGGFLVQTDFASQILTNIWNNNEVLRRVNRFQISGNSNALKLNGMDETSRADGSRAGGILGYWKGEAQEKTASKPKFRQIELKLNKLIGLCYATDELLEDASALERAISTGFEAEFNFKLVDSVINGTGAGQPLGILNSGCLVSISAEGGQAASTIVYENVVKMWARLLPASHANAVWLVNQNCLPQLYQMSLSVGTGGIPVYMPAGGAAGRPFSTLFGRPVLPIEQCQTLGDQGDIILADLAHYLMIDKGGLKRDVSIHVRFVYDESCFRFVLRTDGQPELASAITPFNGTDTLSHFVTIEDRT